MNLGIWQIIIIIAVVIILFGGRGRIASIFSDLGKGIKSLKKELDDEPKAQKNIDKSKNNK